MSSLFEPLFLNLLIRPVTRHLVEALMLDLPLNSAGVVDFGVDSDDHYRVLKGIVLAGGELDEDGEDKPDALEEVRKRILELEVAAGNGSQLNALVKRYAPEYVGRVHFQTDWDVLLGRTEEAER